MKCCGSEMIWIGEIDIKNGVSQTYFCKKCNKIKYKEVSNVRV